MSNNLFIRKIQLVIPKHLKHASRLTIITLTKLSLVI